MIGRIEVFLGKAIGIVQMSFAFSANDQAEHWTYTQIGMKIPELFVYCELETKEEGKDIEIGTTAGG